jgi:hypothetical protein
VPAQCATGMTRRLLPNGHFLALFSKKRKHYLTIGYKDADEKDQVAVIELGKDIVRVTLPIVEIRSGKKIEYQDEEAQNSAGRRERPAARSQAGKRQLDRWTGCPVGRSGSLVDHVVPHSVVGVRVCHRAAGIRSRARIHHATSMCRSPGERSCVCPRPFRQSVAR